MKKRSGRTIVILVVLAFALSGFSALPDELSAQPFSPAAEASAVGGSDRCASAWGLGLGLAAASLSPCSIVCLTMAWYDLALIAAFC